MSLQRLAVFRRFPVRTRNREGLCSDPARSGNIAKRAITSGRATTVAAGAGVADHPSSPGDAGSLEGVSYLVNVAEGDQRTMTVAELAG